VELANYFRNLWNLPEGRPAKSADPIAFTRPAINANPAANKPIQQLLLMHQHQPHQTQVMIQHLQPIQLREEKKQ
jgi:hypothetical protein